MQWNPAVWYSDGVQFLSEVRGEYRKITWPTRQEAVGGTIGVLVIVAIVTSVLGVIDVVLGQAIQLILP